MFASTTLAAFTPSLGLALLLTTACDSSSSPAAPASVSASASRSQAVLAAPGGPARAAPAAKIAPESQSTAAAVPSGALCSPAEVKDLPKTSIGGMGTSASPFTGGPLSRGHATWISLWAAWCEPCKKELPLLVAWQKRMTQAGTPLKLAFISLDDDERQLGSFLTAHPEMGYSYWLREGDEREKYLHELGLSAEPRLPVQLLVSKTGAVLCRIEGAVEEGDYARALGAVKKL